jgi:3',5'-cyclic AMP phosphodiesterase CpdA
MSLILHASDLHFGKADPPAVNLFLGEIERQKPDLVILSGDFTQIGSKEEFIAARDFIEKISAPVFTVPGNHDIPRFQTWQRLFDPMKRYREFISPIVDTIYEDDYIYIVGINTARPVLPHWNWANGMISQEQVDFAYRHFKQAPHHKVRLFVCHHPLVNVKNAPIDTVVWGSTALMDVLNDQKVDLVLTGHIHHASILPGEEGRGPVMIGSASATSTRLRAQSNGYNIVRIAPDNITVELVHWNGTSHVVFETLIIPRGQDEKEGGSAVQDL